MLLRNSRSQRPDHIILDLGGEPVTVRLRFDTRARRYLLRVPADMGTPVLTVPRSGSLASARTFAERNSGWLRVKLKERPAVVGFAAGAIIPVRGRNHLLASTGKLRGLVEVDEAEESMPVLHVPGEEAHLNRRVTDWLRQQARGDLSEAVARHTRTLGVSAARITIRDTSSRWGSCTSDGRLSFCWRLILAPSSVLDYVAAHEVSHLREMNHSVRFWRLCEGLAPQTNEARQWLRDNGLRLHSYG